jgi:hypothetical protein
MRSESNFTDNYRGTLLIELRVTPVSYSDWKMGGGNWLPVLLP